MVENVEAVFRELGLFCLMEQEGTFKNYTLSGVVLMREHNSIPFGV